MACASGVAWPAWAAPVAGQIQLVKGQVFVLDGQSKVVADVEGKRERKVAPGAPFYVGETVVTRDGGRVKLQFVEGGNELVLGANTSLLIQRAGTDAAHAGTTLDLARGEVRANVNRKYSGEGNETFEVKTKNAVAGVRGTIFVTRFDLKSNKSEVATLRGAVHVASMGPGGAMSAGVMVKPGQFTETSPETKSMAVKPLASNPGLKDAVSRLDDGTDHPDKGEAKSDVKGDGAKSDAAKNEAGKNDNPKNDSGAKADADGPKGDGSKGDGSAKNESAKNEPAKNEPAKNESAKGDRNNGTGASVASGDDGRKPDDGAKPGDGGKRSSTGAAAQGPIARMDTKPDQDAPPPAPLGREPVQMGNRGSDASRSPASMGGPITAMPMMGSAATGDAKGTMAGPAAGPLMIGVGPPKEPLPTPPTFVLPPSIPRTPPAAAAAAAGTDAKVRIKFPQ